MPTTLFMSMSMNGMIARPTGSGDFFTDVCWSGFVELVRERGALIWGRKTHDVASFWSSFKRDLVGTAVRGVVLTRNHAYPVQSSWEVADSPRAALQILEERGIANPMVVGGGSVNAAFLREGLVEEVILFVESVIVGKGLPLVTPEAFDVRCRPIRMRQITETVIRLDYRVVR